MYLVLFLKPGATKPLLVRTPSGEIQADQVCSNINLVISKENFTVNPIVLESLDISLVLGNGWLCAQERSMIPSGKFS